MEPAHVAFDPIAGDKSKSLQTAAERRDFLSEYARQIRGQENALNNLTVDEFLSARANFKEFGRNSDAAAAQDTFASQFERRVRENVASKLRETKPELSKREIQNMAREQAKEARQGLAALHEPDNVAGGYTSAAPTRMGDASVNSSIGPAWPSRIGELDAWAAQAKQAGYGDQFMNVRLSVNGSR
jgi:filamentous hemagglutinin